MIFSLDLRRARKGDCFLLHSGTRRKPGLVLVDGGPKGVYGPSLKPRLEAIRKARRLGDQDPLPVDLLMVSHVDDDHIQGLLELTEEELVSKAAQRALMLRVDSFWHNSFDAVVDARTKELTASVGKQFGEASLAGTAELSEDALAEVESVSGEDEEVVTSSLKVLASIEQGFRLRRNAEGLKYRLNPEFEDKLVVAGRRGPLSVANCLTVTVVGPMQPEIDALREKHQEWLRDLAAKGTAPPKALAAYVDRSVPNLSSIVLLAECGGKRMLLTGDARGDKILAGLRSAGLLGPERDAKLEVDLLKVPHHGSANNLEREFFERVVARHYVFSGDGEHGNPEREAMDMLFAARGEQPFTVHLTYPVREIDKARKADWQKEQAKELARRAKAQAVVVRPDWSPRRHGLAELFAARVKAPGQRILVVPAKGKHLVELLTPLGY